MTGISVALCVCNGANYLGEQLSSISGQSRPPDEVVIADDASDDKSLAIIEKFAEDSCFVVRIIRNSTRIGVRANFENAIANCAYDFIALCDQDDIWLPEKLEILSSRLEQDTSISAVFSDAEVVDENLKSLGYTMWETVELTPRRQKEMVEDRAWKVLFKGPVVTGATMMFRKGLMDACLPIGQNWVHDAWIAQVAAAQGQIWPEKDCLILYRQHANNVIGGKQLSLLGQLQRAKLVGRSGLVQRESARYSELFDRLSSLPPSPLLSEMLRETGAKLEHLRIRNELPRNRLLRMPIVTSEWLNGRYRRYARDWRNVLADLLMS